jgi:hypothetical protein
MIATITGDEISATRTPEALPDGGGRRARAARRTDGRHHLLVTFHDHDAGELVVVGVADGARLAHRSPAIACRSSPPSARSWPPTSAAQLCNDVDGDPLYRARRSRSGLTTVGSYLGVPLELADGTRVGSVCALAGRVDRFDDADHARCARPPPTSPRRSSVAAGRGRLASGCCARRAAGRTARTWGISSSLRSLPGDDGARVRRGRRLPAADRDTAMLLSAAALGALAAPCRSRVVPWDRAGSMIRMTPCYGFFVVVALLRDAEGGAQSGLAVLVLLPVLWTALYGSRRELLGRRRGRRIHPAHPAGAGRRARLPRARVPARRGHHRLRPGARHRDPARRAARRDRAADVRERIRDLHSAEEEKRLILATAGEGIIGLDAIRRDDVRPTRRRPR